MNLNRLPLLLLFPFLLIGCQTARQASPSEPPEEAAVEMAPEFDPVETLKENYVSARRLDSELGRVSRWGNGEVLVGRLVTPPGARIASRTTIHPDGSFATALFPGRELVFYAHGYESLVIERRNEIAPSVHDVGVYRFTKSEPHQTRAVFGSVFTSEQREIRLEITISNHAPLGNDHGHWGGQVTVPVVQQRLASGEKFRFEGLSNLPYTLVVSAPDFVTRRFPLDLSFGDRPLGEIILDKAPVLRFDYVSQIDLAQLSGDLERFSQTVVCNGTNRLTYTEERDRHRNALFLRLSPTPSGVEAGHTWHPSDFFDLGPGDLGAFLDGAQLQRLLAESQPSRQILLQSGHVYFFRNEYRNTSCLFQVTDLTEQR